MTTKKTIITILVFIFSIAIFFVARTYYDKRVPNFRATAHLYVYPETTLNAIIDTISAKADTKSLSSLKRCLKSLEVEGNIKPGHYIVNNTHSSTYVARMLKLGWQTPVTLVLQGTMNKKTTIASKISKQLLLDSASVISALNDDALLSEYGFRSDNVFSLIMPDNYEMYWTASIRDVLHKQKEAYEGFWTSERDSLAKKQGLSREQVSILASIVTGETKYFPEMPKVAGVYLNRLAIGMRLQADPTIAYCYDYSLNRILRKHLDFDSPYNTYKYTGLPPGPIQVPFKESLDAVLEPDYGGIKGKGNIYFCANSSLNGTHSFARSYSDHLKNAKAFQKALTKRLKESR